MATGRLPDPNTAPLTAKGDLYTYSTVPAKLAVGNNGETLVADSSATTGLRWTATPSASNPVINGGFDIWQRNTTVAGSTTAFTADRWQAWRTTTGSTFSRQLTGDTTNLPFIQYCLRVARDSGNTNTSNIIAFQNFETVNSIPYAGKTITMSFYARRGANFSGSSNNMLAQLVTGTGTDQNYGNGFTNQASLILQSCSLTTTWQRFSISATVGATVTQLATSFFFEPTGTAGAADYFEITGVQLDVGSVALPFRRTGGTLAGELAACQRYYFRQGGQTLYQRMANGAFNSTTNAFIQMPHPVTMRIAPTSVDYSTMALNDYTSTVAITSISIDYAGGSMTSLSCAVASGGTQYRPVQLLTNNSTSAYVGLSAEL